MGGSANRVETPAAQGNSGQEFKSLLGNSSLSMSRDSLYYKRNYNPRGQVNRYSHRAISSKRA